MSARIWLYRRGAKALLRAKIPNARLLMKLVEKVRPSRCHHVNIQPLEEREDGSQMGVCTSCRDDSFPLKLSKDELEFMADFNCGTFQEEETGEHDGQAGQVGRGGEAPGREVQAAGEEPGEAIPLQGL